MAELKASPEEFQLCYECACYKHQDRMQKYACKMCGGRKCLDLHTTDEVHSCSFCGMSDLCNDCKGFSKCCHIMDEGKFYLRKDKSYLKIK